jgi:hypothetical protein
LFLSSLVPNDKKKKQKKTNLFFFYFFFFTAEFSHFLTNFWGEKHLFFSNICAQKLTNHRSKNKTKLKKTKIGLFLFRSGGGHKKNFLETKKISKNRYYKEKTSKLSNNL